MNLGPAVTPHRAAGRFVGVNAVAVVLEMFKFKGQGLKGSDENRGQGAQTAVSTPIQYGQALPGDDGSVFFNTGFHGYLSGMLAAGSHEFFIARTHELNRPAGMLGEQGGTKFHRGQSVGFAAESAPHVRLDHPDVVRVHIQGERQMLLDVIGRLGRSVHREFAGLIPTGQRCTRFHVAVDGRLRGECILPDMVAFCKGLLRLSLFEVIFSADVIGCMLMDLDGSGFAGLQGIEDRWQLFIFDLY